MKSIEQRQLAALSRAVSQHYATRGRSDLICWCTGGKLVSNITPCPLHGTRRVHRPKGVHRGFHNVA